MHWADRFCQIRDAHLWSLNFYIEGIEYWICCYWGFCFLYCSNISTIRLLYISKFFFFKIQLSLINSFSCGQVSRCRSFESAFLTCTLDILTRCCCFFPLSSEGVLSLISLSYCKYNTTSNNKQVRLHLLNHLALLAAQ